MIKKYIINFNTIPLSIVHCTHIQYGIYANVRYVMQLTILPVSRSIAYPDNMDKFINSIMF